VSDYQNLISGIIDEIANKDNLVRLLKESIMNVSPYDYNRIRYIFETITRFEPKDAIAKKAFLILDILSSYKRRIPPKKTEFESLRTKIPKSIEEASLLYPQSSTRLPYHRLLFSPWVVIEEELDPESLPRLLPLAVPLSISTDQFYVHLVKRTMDKIVRSFFYVITQLGGRLKDTQYDFSKSSNGHPKFATHTPQVLPLYRLQKHSRLVMNVRWPIEQHFKSLKRRLHNYPQLQYVYYTCLYFTSIEPER
jgi:hypothetical protein